MRAPGERQIGAWARREPHLLTSAAAPLDVARLLVSLVWVSGAAAPTHGDAAAATMGAKPRLAFASQPVAREEPRQPFAAEAFASTARRLQKAARPPPPPAPPGTCGGGLTLFTTDRVGIDYTLDRSTYPANADCQWSIRCGSGMAAAIQFSVADFNTDPGDFVSVWDGIPDADPTAAGKNEASRITQWSGTGLPPNTAGFGSPLGIRGQMWVTFTPGGNTPPQGGGFKAEAWCEPAINLGCTNQYAVNYNSVATVDELLSVDSCMMCAATGSVLTGTGERQVLDFMHGYYAVPCAWEIQCGENKAVALNFTALDLLTTNTRDEAALAALLSQYHFASLEEAHARGFPLHAPVVIVSDTIQLYDGAPNDASVRATALPYLEDYLAPFTALPDPEDYRANHHTEAIFTRAGQMMVVFSPLHETWNHGFRAEYWCVPAVMIGCMDHGSPNFLPSATVDDGTCVSGEAAALFSAFQFDLSSQPPGTWDGRYALTSWEGVSLGPYTNLSRVDLAEKSDLHFTLDESISDLASLSHLDLSNTGLHGTIPDSLSTLEHLTSLDLRNTEIRGTLPDWLTSAPLLASLHLSNTGLSGTLPPDLCTRVDRATNLQPDNWIHHATDGLGVPETDGSGALIDLHSMQLQGNIPDFSGCINLVSLRLNNNSFTGLPASLPPSISHVYLGDNPLGATPTELSNLTADLPLLNTMSVSLVNVPIILEDTSMTYISADRSLCNMFGVFGEQSGCKGTRVAKPTDCAVGRECSWLLQLYDADDLPAATGSLAFNLTIGYGCIPASCVTPASCVIPASGVIPASCDCVVPASSCTRCAAMVDNEDGTFTATVPADWIQEKGEHFFRFFHGEAEFQPNRDNNDPYATTGSDYDDLRAVNFAPIECPAGSHTEPDDAGSKCICERGFVSDGDGSTSCRRDCRQRGTQQGDDGECVCAEGFVPGTTEGTCDRCDSWVLCPGGDAPQALCPAGQVANSRQLCENCPSGKAGGRAAHCRTCTGNEVPNPERSACEACKPGQEPHLANTLCEPCEAGKFSTGRDRCEDCPDLQKPTGDRAGCEPCDVGYTPDAAQDQCMPCALGKAGGGIQFCETCPDLQKPTGDRAGCEPCGDGYTPDDAQDQCEPCALGKAGGGSKECSNCQGNTVPNTEPSTICKFCPVGQEADTNNRACQLCVVGKAGGGNQICDTCLNNTVPTSDRTACVACSAGLQADKEFRICEACPEGKAFKDQDRGCEKCDDSQVPNDERTACECNVDYYDPSTTWVECPAGSEEYDPAKRSGRKNDKDVCEVCPPCADCKGGNSEPVLKAGFIQLPAEVLALRPEFKVGFKCDVHGGRKDKDDKDVVACLGGSTFNSSEIRSNVSQSFERCGKGYRGILCNSCAKGFHTKRNECTECEPFLAGAGSWELAAVLLGILAVGMVAWLRSRNSEPTPGDAFEMDLDGSLMISMNPIGGGSGGDAYDFNYDSPSDILVDLPKAQRRSRFNLRVAYNAAFQPARMVVTWVQITSQLGDVLLFDFPDLFQQALDFMRPLMEIWGFIFDYECIEASGGSLSGFVYQFYIKVFALPLATVVIIGMYAAVLRKRKGAEVAIKTAKNYLFGVMFLFYPTICNTVFRSWECRELVKDSVSILEADDRLRCDSTQIETLQFISAIVIVAVSAGVPVFFIVLLVRKSREYELTNVEENSEIARRMAVEFNVEDRVAKFIIRDVTSMGQDFGFLLDAYRPEMYYWESFDMIRKLLLVGLVLLVGRGSVSQSVVALMLSFMFFALQMETKPFKVSQDNLFRAATEIHVFWVIVIALALRSDLSDEVNLSDDMTAEDVYDWSLCIAFLLLIPIGFVATVVSKVLSADKMLDQADVHGSFHRLRLGLHSDEDRADVLAHVEDIRAALDRNPLTEAGIFHDLESQIEGAQSNTAIGTHMCLGEYKATASAEAVKCAIKIRPLDVHGLQAEAAVMTGAAAQHVNICRMFRAAEGDGFHFLAMQLCDATVQSALQAGNLQELLQAGTVSDMCRGAVEGVSALHAAGIVHGNITPSNILLVGGVPKLSGFSSAARITDPMTLLCTTRATLDYRASELMSADGSGYVEIYDPEAADVYALGCTLCFIFSEGNSGVRQHVESSDLLTHEMKDLIGMMLDPTDGMRPSIEEVLAHPLWWNLSDKLSFLGESVGTVLPTKIQRNSGHPFIKDLEQMMDDAIGAYNETNPEAGGSWSRMLGTHYPLGGDWGKSQRSPAQDERHYHIYGAPPSKKQAVEREKQVKAGKVSGAHTAKEIRTVGMLKFIRNVYVHRAQMVDMGRFEDEDAVMHYLLDPYPWLFLAVHKLDDQHGMSTGGMQEVSALARAFVSADNAARESAGGPMLTRNARTHSAVW